MFIFKGTEYEFGDSIIITDSLFDEFIGLECILEKNGKDTFIARFKEQYKTKYEKVNLRVVPYNENDTIFNMKKSLSKNELRLI